ncbi:MAG: TlpA disulfide reductase family protein [Mucilaginibacter sp.]
MKKLILLIIILLPVLAFAQNGKYNVQGTIGNYNAPAKVYLQVYVNDKPVTDSVTLKNGQFHFGGKVGNVPVNAYLIFNEKGTGPVYKDYKSIYLERGDINITTADQLKNAKVDGPKTNEENEKYLLVTRPIDDAQQVIEDKEKAASPEQTQSPEFIKQDNEAQKALDAQRSEMNKKFILDNPGSYISLDALEVYAYGADYADILPLYNSLTDEIKASDAGKQWAKRLIKLKAVALGAMAPEFAEADTSGKLVRLSSFRGKYVLIDFWASWCGPCRHENPNVVKAYNQYKGKNFTIVGISLDQSRGKARWLAAIHKDGLAWTQLSDLQAWNSKEAALYVVRAIPMNFLIDPDGKIIAKNLHGDDLENKLAELLGKI